MSHSSIPPDLTFTARARTLGIVAAWMTFIVNEVYAVVSGLAYVSQGAAVESGPFLSIMALLVVVMGPFLVLSMVAVHAYASPNNKPYSLAAFAFMVACVSVTSCINFLLLLVSSQPHLFSESWRALFLPCKWPAPAFILDNFVWDWFFGISMLLAAPIFGGNTLKAALRFVMTLSGTLCLAGLAWLVISPAQAIIIGVLGWGGQQVPSFSSCSRICLDVFRPRPGRLPRPNKPKGFSSWMHPLEFPCKVKSYEEFLAMNNKSNDRVFGYLFANIYPLYIEKAERKNRTKEEVDKIIFWLTGYNQAGLQQQIKKGNDLKTFFDQAPAIDPNRSLIKGVVCGVRVEEIEDPLMQKIRYLDKLIDELAKGKALEKILRQ